jgi:hypothetical protein
MFSRVVSGTLHHASIDGRVPPLDRFDRRETSPDRTQPHDGTIEETPYLDADIPEKPVCQAIRWTTTCWPPTTSSCSNSGEKYVDPEKVVAPCSQIVSERMDLPGNWFHSFDFADTYRLRAVESG